MLRLLTCSLLAAALLMPAFASAALPGANGKIAFVSGRDGNDEIYVMNADGSNQTSISRSPAADSRPSWSPDGKRIAFVSDRSKSNNYDIYVMDADGSRVTRLTDNEGLDGDPAWSPKGATIAFATNRSGDFEIYMMDANGENQRNISNNPAFDGKPAWSLDGSKLAFTSNRGAGSNGFDIFMMDADGRNARQLTDNTVTDDEPSWSPDGTKVVYQTERDGSYEISVVSALAFARSGSQAKGSSDLRSIAVLPFATENLGSGDQYLGVGLAETLTRKLAQVSALVVRPTGSVRRYLGSTQSPVEIGRELGVDYVLAGSVEATGESVRNSLSLTEVSTDKVIWSEAFDVSAANVMALSDSVSERVVSALKLELSNDERDRLTKRYTQNTEALQLYLAGRYYLSKRTPEGVRQAISNFERAIEKDSGFALAYTGLADSYALLNWYMEPPPADAFARAKQAALRAVELDNNLAESYSSLAFIKFYYDRDWSGAEQDFRRAISINPNYAPVRHWYAMTLSAQGRHAEAVTEIERALALDPRSAIIVTALANIQYYARRYDEAIERCLQALEMDPGSSAAQTILRWAYEKKGMYDRAYAIYEQEQAFAGDSPTTRAKLAHWLAASGKTSEARKIVREVVARRKQQWVTSYEIATIYALLGDSDEAFSWLAKARDEHAVGFTFVGVDPLLDNIRNDPRFADLLRT